MADKKYEKLRELIGANLDQQQQQGRLRQLEAEHPAFLQLCESFVNKFGSAQQPVRSAAGPSTSLPRIKPHSNPHSSPAQPSTSFLNVLADAARGAQPPTPLPQIEPHSSPQIQSSPAQPSPSVSVPGTEIQRALPPSSTISQLARSSPQSQRNAVPERHPLRRTISLRSKSSGAGFDFGAGPASGPRSTGPSPSSKSRPMAFFSTQPQQQQSFPQQQTPQLNFQPPQQQLQGQFQVLQQQLSLYTKDKVPAGWNTKFSDLHEDSQKLLLQIEDKMREFRQESEKLDQCIRLYDSSVSNDSFEVDATRIVQELGGTNTAIEREKASLQELITNVKDMIRRTELAIHTYMMIRPRFTKPTTGTAQNTGTASIQPVNQIVPASPVMPVFDFYSGVPKRPSAFMQQTADRLQKYLEDCERWIEELEQLVQIDANRRGSDSLVALPKVMSNVHSYFIYVASKAEKLHQYVESMRTAYLIEQRQHGSNADPFLEADRREAARLEAAARRVHPTLHLPATQNPPQQPNTQNPTPTFQQQTLQPNPTGFLTPAPASSSGGLFSTPSGSAPSSALFGPSAGFTPQSTPFGSTSGSLFGSTPTPAFGSTTPGLSSTPAIGAGSALFTTPSFGGANVSGASFGGASKSSRPKTRTSRR